MSEKPRKKPETGHNTDEDNNRDTQKGRSGSSAPLNQEAIYRAAVETAPDPITVYGPDGKVVYVNPAFTEVFGWTFDELCGKHLDFVPEDEMEKTSVALRHVLTGERVFLESRRQKKNGELIDLQMKAGAFFGPDGQLAGLIVISRDISEQKKARVALRESEERHRQVLDTNPEPVVVYDMEGNVSYFNPAFTRVFGWTIEECVGKKMDHFVPGQCWPETKIMIDKVNTCTRFNDIETLRYNKNGDLIPVSISGANYLDREGRPVGSVITLKDITERKRAEEELKIQKTYLENLLESSPEAIAVLTIDQRIQRINSEFTRLFGYSSEEAVGRFINDLIIPSDMSPGFMEMSGNNVGDDIVRIETVRRRKDGSLVDVSVWATHIFGEHAAEGIYAIYRDITSRKRAQEALSLAKQKADEASQAKSEFVARMSHEIRTPMNAILGMAEILSDTGLTPDQRKYLAILQTSGELLLSTINNILDFSKIEAGRVRFESIPFDLIDLVENVGTIMGVRAHEKGLELVCRVDPKVACFRLGDPVRVKQVIVNLLGNAIKFTDHGEVVLEIMPGSDGQDAVHASVRDTGIGISSENHTAIFGSFSQADTSTTRQFGGTGLGLAICKHLVEQMGGRIWVESRLGHGTVIHLTLRLPIDASQTATDADGMAKTGKKLKGIPILVVDDNATSRMVITETLSSWGADPGDAESGFQALCMLRARWKAGNPYRLVLLDIAMPGMTGFELAEKIGQMCLDSRPGLLMMGETDNHEFKARAKKLGIRACLLKPAKRGELLSEILSALGLKKEKSPRGKTSPIVGTDLPALDVLLVEDIEPNRMVVHRFLKGSPISITDAENGLLALEKFKQGAFDLVLMDIEMPVMDGLTATREIRSWEKAQQKKPTPIFALTAHVFVEQRRECMDAGCDAFLAKPLEKKKLCQVLGRIAGRKTENELENMPETSAATGNRVQIDRELDDLIPDLIAYIGDSLNTLERAVFENDFKEIHRLGHGLKGAVRNYGFGELGELFFNIEKSAQNKDAENAEKGIRKIRQYMDQMEIVFH